MGLGSSFVLAGLVQAVQVPTNVKEFGAVGNGTTDDTAAIQSALNSRKRILFPEGTYLVTAQLNLPSETNILLTPKTTIHFNCATVNPSLFTLNSVKSIKIDGAGGRLVGDVKEHPTGTHNGIGIFGNSEGISIERLTISDFPDDVGRGGRNGDGIYVGGPLKDGTVPSQITISHCNFSHNGRNQISIVAAHHVQIDHCHMTGSNLDGVDLEPNNDTDTEAELKVIDNVISGSRCGISVIRGAKNILIESNQVSVPSDEETKPGDYNDIEGIHVNCKGPNVVVKTNIIHGGYMGITGASGNPTITGNQISDARLGVWIRAAGVTVDHNKIVDVWEQGIRVQGNDAVITDNVIQDVGDQTKLFNHKVSHAYAIEVNDGYTNGTVARNTIKDTRPHGESRSVIRLAATGKGGETWKSDIKP